MNSLAKLSLEGSEFVSEWVSLLYWESPSVAILLAASQPFESYHILQGQEKPSALDL